MGETSLTVGEEMSSTIPFVRGPPRDLPDREARPLGVKPPCRRENGISVALAFAAGRDPANHWFRSAILRQAPLDGRPASKLPQKIPRRGQRAAAAVLPEAAESAKTMPSLLRSPAAALRCPVGGVLSPAVDGRRHLAQVPLASWGRRIGLAVAVQVGRDRPLGALVGHGASGRRRCPSRSASSLPCGWLLATGR